MRQLLVATTNAGKQAEFKRLFAGLHAQIVTPEEIGLELSVDEPYLTYAENAVAKASAYSVASGLLSVADDSGIEVAALDWGPGVHSARWGGGRNAERLLQAVGDSADRRARMVCALAVAQPSPSSESVKVFTGSVEGSVTRVPRGAGGFGYDPVFVLPNGMTTAQLPADEKDRVSHRGRAAAAAAPYLRALLESG